MKHPKPSTKSLRKKLSVGAVVGLAAIMLVMVAATAPAEEAVEKPTPPIDTGLTKVGESLFRAYCTSCHGAAAEGDGPLAESLRVEPADLTVLAKKNGGEFPFEQVRRKIDGRERVRGHGSSDMPVWGRAFKQADDQATDQQVDDKVLALAHFVRSLQGP